MKTERLTEQLERLGCCPEPKIPLLAPDRSPARDASEPLPARELIFHNGLGGFTRDGREYVITLAADQVTPAPWVNVLANPFFGTVVSESGSGYTWVENCHEFRLTPWNNDPGQRHPGRSLLPPGRADGTILVAHPAARARRNTLRHSSRLRLYRV